MEGGGDGEIGNTQKKQICSTLGDRHAKEKKQKGREMLGARGVRLHGVLREVFTGKLKYLSKDLKDEKE